LWQAVSQCFLLRFNQVRMSYPLDTAGWIVPADDFKIVSRIFF